MLNKLFYGLIIFACVNSACEAFAVLPSYPVAAIKPNCVIPVQPNNQTVNFNNPLVVPGNLPVGGIIASALSSPGYSFSGITCRQPEWQILRQLTLFTTPTGLQNQYGLNVYATNVQGVGIVVDAFRYAGETGSFNFPAASYAINPGGTTYGGTGLHAMVSLIKTGDIGTGSITPGIIAIHWENGYNMARIQIGSIAIKPEVATCSFSTPNVVVPLGEHQTSEFNGVGTFTQPWVPFDLVATTCTAETSTIHMSFSGTVASGGNPNLFAVTGGATGVGVDIQTTAGAQAVPNSTTPMDFPAQQAGGTYSFQARYMQSEPTIGTGSANANVVVGLTYN